MAAEELQDGLAHAGQSVERGGRVRLRLEFAQDRACRGGTDGPDRVGLVGGQVSGAHADDLAQERGERPISVAGRQTSPQSLLDARGVIA